MLGKEYLPAVLVGRVGGGRSRGDAAVALVLIHHGTFRVLDGREENLISCSGW